MNNAAVIRNGLKFWRRKRATENTGNSLMNAASSSTVKDNARLPDHARPRATRKNISRSWLPRSMPSMTAGEKMTAARGRAVALDMGGSDRKIPATNRTMKVTPTAVVWAPEMPRPETMCCMIRGWLNGRRHGSAGFWTNGSKPARIESPAEVRLRRSAKCGVICGMFQISQTAW